jgi:hypothetical protein
MKDATLKIINIFKKFVSYGNIVSWGENFFKKMYFFIKDQMELIFAWKLCRLISSNCRTYRKYLLVVKFSMMTYANYFYYLFYDNTQSRQSNKLFLKSSELGLPQPLIRRRVCPPPPVLGGGAHSLAREGLGESQLQRKDIHWGTLYIRSLCDNRSRLD